MDKRALRKMRQRDSSTILARIRAANEMPSMVITITCYSGQKYWADPWPSLTESSCIA